MKAQIVLLRINMPVTSGRAVTQNPRIKSEIKIFFLMTEAKQDNYRKEKIILGPREVDNLFQGSPYS